MELMGSVEHFSGEIRHCRSIEEVNGIIRAHEKENGIKFVVQCARKNFGQSDWRSQSKSIKWKCKGWEFDGVPLAVTSVKALDCKQGKDRHSCRYQKSNNKVGSNEDRQKVAKKVTSKLNCPARLVIKEIIRFPEYKIASETKYNRRNTSLKLRAAIQKGESVQWERWFIVFLPFMSSHLYHMCGVTAKQDSDKSQPDGQDLNYTLAELQELVTNNNDPIISAVTFADAFANTSVEYVTDSNNTAVVDFSVCLDKEASTESLQMMLENRSAVASINESDECQQFGLFVANELRSLPTEQHKFTLMLKIQDMLTEAQQNTHFYP